MRHLECEACGRELEPNQVRFCSKMCRDTFSEVFGVASDRESFEDEDDTDLKDADDVPSDRASDSTPPLYRPSRFVMSSTEVEEPDAMDLDDELDDDEDESDDDLIDLDDEFGERDD